MKKILSMIAVLFVLSMLVPNATVFAAAPESEAIAAPRVETVYVSPFELLGPDVIPPYRAPLYDEYSEFMSWRCVQQYQGDYLYDCGNYGEQYPFRAAHIGAVHSWSSSQGLLLETIAICAPMPDCLNTYDLYFRVKFHAVYATPGFVRPLPENVAITLSIIQNDDPYFNTINTMMTQNINCGYGDDGMCTYIWQDKVDASEIWDAYSALNYFSVTYAHTGDYKGLTIDYDIQLSLQPIYNECQAQYYVPSETIYPIDPTIAEPLGPEGSPADEQVRVTEVGEIYKIETNGGPWDDDPEIEGYWFDTAISWDGITYTELNMVDALCYQMEADTPDLMTLFVEAQSTTLYIRVNDYVYPDSPPPGHEDTSTYEEGTDFSDNEEIEPLTYTFGLAFLVLTTDCSSQFTYDAEADLMAEVTIPSTSEAGIDVEGEGAFIPEEWYAVAVVDGRWKDTDLVWNTDLQFQFFGEAEIDPMEFAPLTEGSPNVYCVDSETGIVYLQASRTHMRLRVNNTIDSTWANNTGSVDAEIYHATFNRAQEACELSFAIDEIVTSDTIDAKQKYGKVFALAVGSAISDDPTDTGNYLSFGLVPGAWYMLETTGGPWWGDGETEGGYLMPSYELAVAEELANTLEQTPEEAWEPLAEWERAECNVLIDGLGHRNVYFQMDVVAAEQLKLRVFDEDGAWNSNSGFMGWNLYRVIDLGADVVGCDYSMGETPLGLSQTVRANALNGAPIMEDQFSDIPLNPDSYYGIVIHNDNSGWYEDDGYDPLLFDMQISANNGKDWADIPGNIVLCYIEDEDHPSFIIRTGDQPEYKLRVDSTTFDDNSGMMIWDIYDATPGDSIDPWDGCVTAGYDITLLSTFEWIPILDENGRFITSSSSADEQDVLLAGNTYIVEIAKGPWHTNAEEELDRWYAQVSSDGGDTWQAMDGTNTDVSCWEYSQDFRYYKIEFTVQSGQEWKIRVDDEEDGDWTDNTGNLAYVLKSLTVPDDSPMPGWIDVMPGCDTPPLTPGALDAGDIFSAEVISNLGNYIAGWFDYLTASVVRFFAWCPEHTAYMMTMGDGIKLREPFATLDEMDRQLNDIKNEISGYGFDYDGTDYSILNKSPSESVSMINEYMFGELPEDSPWIDGDLVSFEANPDVEFTDECGLALTDYIGPRLSQGVCFSTDWAREVGMLFWVQLLLDAGVFFACIASVVGNLRKLIYLFTGVNFGTQSGDAKVFVTNVMSEDSPWKGRR